MYSNSQSPSKTSKNTYLHDQNTDQWFDNAFDQDLSNRGQTNTHHCQVDWSTIAFWLRIKNTAKASCGRIRPSKTITLKDLFSCCGALK